VTSPSERYWSLRQARDFMEDLTDRSITPDVPQVIRDRAVALLRHFPQKSDFDAIELVVPELISRDWRINT
jgi:hypothetical protein